MSRSTNRRALAAGTALALVLLVAPAVVQAQTARFDFNLPAEPLADSLRAVGQRAGVTVAFDPASVSGKTAPALKGNFSAEDAVDRVITGSGLSLRTTSGGSIIVANAMAAPKNAEAAPDSGAASSNAGDAIEIVTVTAEKRTESALEVPMGLTALSGEDLARTQSYRFEDYVGKVPGLVLLEGGAGGSELIIRGLTTGGSDVSSGVAIYVDETPILPNSAFANSTISAPDFDTFDMNRIEVLKGPQGTLYGANALGGLLKYVTNAPDPSAFAATVEAGVDSVDHGGIGFDYHAMVNVPLASDLALRVVGYDNYYPGFIDDPSRGLKDINGAHYSGGRASLLYQPAANLSIRFNVIYQDRQTDDYGNGSEDVYPGTLKPIYGPLTQERVIAQPANAFMELYNVTIDWNAGFAKLVSTSSYTLSHFDLIADDFGFYGPYTPILLGAPYGIATPLKLDYNSFVQEMRLSSEDDGPLKWQIGGYFTHQNSLYRGALIPIDYATHTILYNFPEQLAVFHEPATYQEYAGFANLDYNITPTFDVALGGRYSANSQTYGDNASGILYGGSTHVNETSSQGVFTYSGDARWHFMPNSMLYARIAEGYVPGGPNSILPGSTLPAAYNSSTTTNYEVGIKSSLLDDHLTVELSAYHIDWHDIQLTLDVGGFSGIDNAGTAHNDGVEWNFRYIPIDGLTLGFNGSYTSASITQVQPQLESTIGEIVGARLPFVPLWQSSASIAYERPLFDGYSGFAGLDWRYTDSRDANFATGQVLPAFTIVDLRAGIETQRWTASLYVKNLGNSMAINNLNGITLAGSYGPQSAAIYPPRTIGFTVTANF